MYNWWSPVNEETKGVRLLPPPRRCYRSQDQNSFDLLKTTLSKPKIIRQESSEVSLSLSFFPLWTDLFTLRSMRFIIPARPSDPSSPFRPARPSLPSLPLLTRTLLPQKLSMPLQNPPHQLPKVGLLYLRLTLRLMLTSRMRNRLKAKRRTKWKAHHRHHPLL